jgi:hypothetical protein
VANAAPPPAEDWKPGRRLVAAAVVISAFVVAFAFWRSLPTPHMTVELHNDTGAPMTDVHFVFADGQGLRACEKIPAEGMVVWDLKGQSQGFSVDYRDADGRVVSRKCSFAFDGDDWGAISVRIKQGGLKVLTEVDPTGPGSKR